MPQITKLIVMGNATFGFELRSEIRGKALAPGEEAGDGDDDVEAVEGAFEGDVLVEVEDAGHDINGYPDEPLLEVFMGKRPNASHAQCRGETVGEGHRRVGEMDKQIVDGRPQRRSHRQPKRGKTRREMGDGPRLSLLVPAPGPHGKSVGCHAQVIKLHAAVGIEAFLVIEHDAQHLHDGTHRPHPSAGI